MEIRMKSELNLNGERMMRKTHQFGSQSHILQKKEQVNSSQKISQCHSECLNNNKIQSADLELSKRQKLYLLLVKFKLQQLGFRKYEYQKFLLPLENNILTLEKIQQNVVKICEKIIQSKENDRINISKRQLIIQQNNPKRKISTLIIQKQDYLFICPVCCDQIYQSKLTQILQCNHKFCDNCIKSTIEQSIKQAKYDMLCLQISCTIQVPQKLIENALSPQKYSRYQYFKKKKILESDSNNKFCTKPNCQGLLESIDNKNKCSVCNTQYCKTCLRKYHEGDCETHIQQIIQQVYIHLKIKKCPKCKSPIEKSEGCNHMTCKKCNYEFCWICLGPYTRYHYRYYNCFGCPGMQFQDQQDQFKERLKQILFFLLLPFIIFAIISLFLLGLPIYIIIMILLRPYTKALESSYNNSCCDCCNCYECCDCCQDISQWGCKCLLLFILYLPQGLLYGLFVCPFKYFAMFYYQVIQIFD